MGFLGRLMYATASVIALAGLGIVYAQAGVPLINMAQRRGGPFTTVVDSLETMMPLLIGALLLFVPIWFIISGAQQERARDRRRPPL
jgi:hypothetical protein